MPRGYGMSAGQRRLAGRISHPRRATVEQVQAWEGANPDNARALAVLVASEQEGTLNSFTSDILAKLRRYGSLSERQVAAVLRGAARDAEYAARREAERIELKGAAPLAEGRRLISGEIISAKWKATRFGTQPKMLLREESGNKVWGTIPASLVPDDEDVRSLIGETVTLTGTVRRSDDDQHFGFFSRPQFAQIGSGVPAPAEVTAAPLGTLADWINPNTARCPAGHAYDVRDGFCEACAEAAMEFGEDL